MKITSSLSFVLMSAILAFSSKSFSSTALPMSSNSHIAKTSAINSNLFRNKIRETCAQPGYGRSDPALFSAADGAISNSPSSRDAMTTLPGLFSPRSKSTYSVDFDWLTESMSIWKRIVGAFKFFFSGALIEATKFIYTNYFRKGFSITVYDARAKEAEEGLSKADFFEKYGFVLLNATSAMTAEGWEASNRDQLALVKEYKTRNKDDGAAYKKRMDNFRNEETPVKQIYAEEAKILLKSIIPRATEIMPPAKGIRRRIDGGLVNGPAKQVHNDYGLVFDDVVERNPYFDFAKQRAIYEETQSNEFMLINMWRPIKPMSTPLRSYPLCFLDRSTLSKEDLVIIDTKSSGTLPQLKENPNHKFYYYPDMTVDEVVVFKQFHKVRDETIARMPTFHTAFPDPDADENTEGRVSFEYRVSVLA